MRCRALLHRLYGRDMKSISRFLGNKTLAATRLFWSRHRVRLGLDALMVERENVASAAATPTASPAAASAALLPDVQAWASLLQQLQLQQQRQAAAAATTTAAATAPLTAPAPPDGNVEEAKPLANGGTAHQPAPAAAAVPADAEDATPTAMADGGDVADGACTSAAALAAGDETAGTGTQVAAAAAEPPEPKQPPLVDDDASADIAAAVVAHEELDKVHRLLEPGARRHTRCPAVCAQPSAQGMVLTLPHTLPPQAACCTSLRGQRPGRPSCARCCASQSAC